MYEKLSASSHLLPTTLEKYLQEKPVKQESSYLAPNGVFVYKIYTVFVMFYISGVRYTAKL